MSRGVIWKELNGESAHHKARWIGPNCLNFHHSSKGGGGGGGGGERERERERERENEREGDYQA